MDKVRRNKTALVIFLLPATILFAVIIIIPIFMSGYYSLLEWDGITKGTFVGLGNYINLFKDPSIQFSKTLWHAVIIALCSVLIQLPISLGLALILAKGIKGERFFLSVFFIPVLISSVVIGQLWLKIYNPNYGLLNTFLKMVGLSEWTHTWLGEEKTALAAVMIPILWQFIGYHMLLFYAGIKSVPKELIEELEKRCGRKIIGNKSASGTEILEELAEEEIATGHMIVYTSADSVLQICGNEETFGLEELYRCCEIARELTMRPEWKVGRVIARPYTGMKKGEFKRTANRHDYALKPYGKTVLNALEEAGYDVISVGKINDIFAGEGITRAYKSQSSVHGMEQTIEIAKEKFSGLCFVNLVDFDAVWGHRRDVYGYAKELEKFDRKLEELLTVLTEEDLLMITADHGTDPTYKGTDHTREDVPLLIYSKEMEKGGQMEEQETFAVIGATIADNFDIKMPEGTIGRSIWQ